MNETILYDYWRSSAAYRVRIALHLAGIPFRSVAVNLLAGEHKDRDHLARNPQGLVPALEIDGIMLTQSLAIIEYLDETRGANLLPQEAEARARVRALSYAVAMEIHPVCNMSVASHVAELTGGGDETKKAWMQTFIARGLAALETMISREPRGEFAYGDRPGMADICLVPQVYNAERWEVPMADYPMVAAIAERANSQAPFALAHPEAVKPV